VVEETRAKKAAGLIARFPGGRKIGRGGLFSGCQRKGPQRVSGSARGGRSELACTATAAVNGRSSTLPRRHLASPLVRFAA
jgi:hypothetical protein